MQYVNLTVDEFNNFEYSEYCTGIDDKSKMHILHFYKKYPQDCIYIVSGEREELNAAFENNYAFYRKFGIYAQAHGDRVGLINEQKQYLLIIAAAITEERYKIMCQESGCDCFSDCIIEIYDTELSVQLMTILESINTLPDSMNVWNVFNTGVQRSSSRNNDLNYFDVSEIFHKYNFTFADNNDNVKSVLRLYNELLQVGKPSDVLVLEKSNKNDRLVFAQIAVALSLAGRHIEISDETTTIFFALYRRIFSREYMFLEDYLDKLADPVDMALLIQENLAFVCTRDGSIRRNDADADIELQIYATKFDTKRKSLIDKNSVVFNCYYRQLKVIPLYDLFDMTGDFKTATEVSFALDDVLASLEEIISEEYSAVECITLNISNTLFFEYEGETYVGYVSRIERDFEYKLIPLSSGYKNFETTFNVNQYDMLLDINVLADGDHLIPMLEKFVRKDKCHFKVPRCVKGCLLRTMKATARKYVDECGLSFDEIGLWSIHTSQCRMGSQAILLEYFNKSGLRDRKFLTAWGGSHPAVLTELTVDYRIWK